MKDYLELKRQPLPNHVERSFFKAWKFTAREHGYTGLLGMPRFLYRRAMDHFLQVISRVVPYSGIRVRLHRMRGVKIGKNAHIGPMVTIDDVYPNFVVIEDGVSLAGQIYILTHNKPLEYHKHLSEAFLGPVIIKKNAWIAIGVIILPGVTIGEGSIVASGAVVAKDVPPHTMVGGIPAKIIREFEMKDGIPVGFKKH
jgi:acetyltransferase-like isoleucine patch superfamily enzyme